MKVALQASIKTIWLRPEKLLKVSTYIQNGLQPVEEVWEADLALVAALLRVRCVAQGLVNILNTRLGVVYFSHFDRMHII